MVTWIVWNETIHISRLGNLLIMFFQEPHLQLGRAPAPCEGVQDGNIGKEQVLVSVAAPEQRQVAAVWQRDRSVARARCGVIPLNFRGVLCPLPAVQL